MRFNGFYGNEAARVQLSGAFDSGREPHAILIDGPAGSGKKTLARLIAQAFVCEGTGERPCGECRQCRNARAGVHPDIRMDSAAGGARSFSVDTVRRIRLDAFVAPNDAAVKVYILDGVHNMTESAQNALLKILEEPPAHVRFILTCDGRSRVLETVQSRCTGITLGPVPEEQVTVVLLQRDPTLDRDQAVRAAQLSGGYIGRAAEGLAQGSFSAAVALADDFTKALCGSSPFAFLRLSGTLEKDSELFRACLELLPLLFRDAIASRAGVSGRLSGCGEAADRLRGAFTPRQLAAGVDICLNARAAADRYANQRLLLTWFFARLWQVVHEGAGLGAG